MGSQEKIKDKPGIEDLMVKKGNKNLLLFNDDVHTFDYVIDALIDICDHESEQAEQCTFLVHYKGKCDVKKGSLTYLKPMKDGLVRRGLKAVID